MCALQILHSIGRFVERLRSAPYIYSILEISTRQNFFRKVRLLKVHTIIVYKTNFLLPRVYNMRKEKNNNNLKKLENK